MINRLITECFFRIPLSFEFTVTGICGDKVNAEMGRHSNTTFSNLPFFIIFNRKNIKTVGLWLIRDDSKYGYDSDGGNFYLKPHHEFQKMVLISFKDL